MKILFEIFEFVLAFGALSLFFIGIFYPKLLIKKPFIGRRLLLAFVPVVILSNLGIFIQKYKINHIYSSEEREQYYADIHRQDSINAAKTENKNSTENKTIIILSDSAILHIYKHEFDSLYNKLISLDKIEYVDIKWSQLHKKIQNLLFERWWNTMESVDSTHVSLPLSYKAYRECGLLYDKQYARFVIYGNEDVWEINNSAKYEAERILTPNVH